MERSVKKFALDAKPKFSYSDDDELDEEIFFLFFSFLRCFFSCTTSYLVELSLESDDSSVNASTSFVFFDFLWKKKEIFRDLIVERNSQWSHFISSDEECFFLWLFFFFPCRWSDSCSLIRFSFELCRFSLDRLFVLWCVLCRSSFDEWVAWELAVE